MGRVRVVPNDPSLDLGLFGLASTNLSAMPFDMELFFNKYGEEGPPLILLHGLLGANGNWHTLSRTAFQEVATVYAVDQRNHGRSPHTDRIDYPSMAADVKEFILGHDLKPAHLLGHSMGGKTAMQTALTDPDLVERLVVVDMAPRAYEPRHDEILDALAGIDPSNFEGRDEIDAVLAEDIPSVPVRQFLLKNLNYDGNEYEWKMNLDAIQAHYDDLNAAVKGEAPFNGPALFVRGEQSDYVSDADVSLIKNLFPKAEIVTIDGAGHWVHVDAPDALATLVTKFLQSEGVPSG